MEGLFEKFLLRSINLRQQKSKCDQITQVLDADNIVTSITWNMQINFLEVD